MQNDNRIGEECGVFAIYDPDGIQCGFRAE